MLENILIHFVFLFFIFSAFVWWLRTKRKYDVLTNALLPTILLGKFVFPEHRSLVVRSCEFLEQEFSLLFISSIKIDVPLSRITSEINFMKPLSSLLSSANDFAEQEKSFILEDKYFSSKELKLFLVNQSGKNKIIFHWNLEKHIWELELINA